jgi:hypothetical protein
VSLARASRTFLQGFGDTSKDALNWRRCADVRIVRGRFGPRRPSRGRFSSNKSSSDNQERVPMHLQTSHNAQCSLLFLLLVTRTSHFRYSVRNKFSNILSNISFHSFSILNKCNMKWSTRLISLIVHITLHHTYIVLRRLLLLSKAWKELVVKRAFQTLLLSK